MILAPPRAVHARSLGAPALATASAAAAVFVVLRLAVCGVLPAWAVALLAPAAALALVASVFHLGVAIGPLAVDERGEQRPLTRRHGFWIVALGIALGLPALGAFSLVDPWETHYAEVARAMVERRDLISPWWAHDGWFMSKPVLVFWLEALAMVVLGVRTGPDQVLAGVTHAAARPEWAARLPTFAFAIVGAYVLYHGVSRTCGRRAGFAAGAVLLTMPGYALLSHQALTDMPLVASVAASLGFLLRAQDTLPDARVRRWSLAIGGRALTIHAGHLLAACVVISVLPQIAMLLASHVHLGASGLHLGADRVVSGSPQACTLPGQPACAALPIAHPRLAPVAQAAFWIVIAVWLVPRVASETRAARLFALAAWFAAGVGAMAKGPAALVIPAGAMAVSVAARRSWRDLLRLEIVVGLGLVILLVLPWYVAVYARHGRVFIDELVLRHMLGRTLDHLHDTNEGADVGITYFVRQLGYATFPWSGLAAVAALSAPAQAETSRRGDARTLSYGAALLAFALVSSMRTKFHHYGLVVLPPAAALAGIWADERIAEASSRRGRSRFASTAVLFTAAAAVVALVGRDLASAGAERAPSGTARLVALMTYRYDRVWPSSIAFAPAVLAASIGASIATWALAVRAWRRRAAVATTACAIAFAAMLLDGYLVRVASDGGQRGIFEAYYRERTTASPLVAYQLNWKGENFYSGNNVAIFVSSGAPMRTYLDARRRRGEDTVYFVTERRRIEGLRAELGAVRSFEVLTDASVSHEFGLVRARL